ncbi:MAG TPA: hypothetical protein VFO71_07260 [Gemmatimonadales bacterium]|nr:hypothetical protein [Gemmatimonadales bacterium]
MLPIEYLSKIRAAHWIALAATILLIDYLTGPFIQFPILFVLPVALATATHGRTVGSLLAVLLPVVRLSFFLQWALPSSWTLEAVDTAVDVAVLIGFSVLIDQLIRQQREIRVLEGMLPICGFCKRIRDERGGWHQLESFITLHSGALFSHTFCQECGRKHYPGMVE